MPSPSSSASSVPESAVGGKPADQTSKINWKNGPPSCKECMRLKLKTADSVREAGRAVAACAADAATFAHLARFLQVRELQDENTRLKSQLETLKTTDVSSDTGAGPSPVLSFPPMTLEPTLQGTNLIADDPVLQHFTCELRDDEYVATASGSGSGLLEHDREGGRYLGRGAGALFVCEAEDSQTISIAEEPMVLMKCDLELLTRLHDMFPATAAEAKGLLDTYPVTAVLESIYSAKSLHAGIHRVAPHRLASLVMIFALAHVFSFRPSSTHVRYYNAAWALLTIPGQNFFMRHSLAAVETLHLMVTYLFGTGRSDAARAAWPLLGLCVRTACAIGLHRDSAAWGLGGDAKIARDRLWWECATYDILQSLNFGRPYSAPQQLCDCPCPPLSDGTGAGPNGDDGFHSLKYRLAEQFFKVADCLATSDLPDYHVVMELDGALRRIDGSAPAWLRWSEGGAKQAWAPELSERQLAQQHAATLFAHKALLVHAYTAAVIQSTVLLRVPQCMMADEVRADFEKSYETIAGMTGRSAVARRAMPLLTRLRDKVHAAPLSPSGTGVSDDMFINMLLGNLQPESQAVAPDQGLFSPWGNFMGETNVDALGMGVPSSTQLVPPQPVGCNNPAGMSELDPLLQTLLYWNASNASGNGNDVESWNGT
ncbi:hypothetical protein EHS25_002776 [Saitozyma podzolica]|uniref:Xylanolytic transcriptional activator regulatory domain-containing protein n=1 Tax=Saitozyma podzolica TaxID=1890683 RepID=A0A427YDB0_9TREE|nr:hypothetical protein EHS25_002776 [Saitozyma podzolica]